MPVIMIYEEDEEIGVRIGLFIFIYLSKTSKKETHPFISFTKRILTKCFKGACLFCFPWCLSFNFYMALILAFKVVRTFLECVLSLFH